MRDTFLEPFAGGASVGLEVARRGLCDRVVLTELDERVVEFWWTLLHSNNRDFERFLHMLERFTPSIEHVTETLEATPSTLVERAFQTLVRNRTSYGGNLTEAAGRIRDPSVRWYPNALHRRCLLVRSLADRVTVEHRDALDAIGQYARLGTMVFADPPYPGAGPRLYRHHELEHDRLIGTLQAAGVPWIASYEDSEVVRGLADRHSLHVREVSMHGNRGRPVTELLLSGEEGP